MDDEKLAALLDGRVRRAERKAMVGHLATADEDYHTFAESAAILRALEPSPRTLRRRRRVRRRALRRRVQQSRRR